MPATPRSESRARLTEEGAAVALQAAWRRRLARARLVDIAKAAYEKVFDESSGSCYFYNKKTQQSSWELPGFCAFVESRL